jgi:hypothetical protein
LESVRKYYGIYRGSVYSNKDPLNQRRLRILVPAILGTSPTQWAWPVDPSGAVLVPPSVKQGVWVMFENGDPSFPLWVGTFGKWTAQTIRPKLGGAEYIPNGMSTSKTSDGTLVIDLLETLVALEQRIADLEADMPIALQNGL